MAIATFNRPAVIAVTGEYPTLACALFAWARASAAAVGAPWPSALLAALDDRIGDPLDPVQAARIPAAFAAADAAAIEAADGWTVPDTSALVAAAEARTFRGEGITWGTGESRVHLHMGGCGEWCVTISGPVGSAAAARAEAIGWPDTQVAVLRSGVIPVVTARSFGGGAGNPDARLAYGDDEACEA
jgi:hypothetical protein